MERLQTSQRNGAQEKRNKDKRHIDNLAHFTGWYHNKYFIDGVWQPNKKLGIPQHDSLLTLERTITSSITSGTIYERTKASSIKLDIHLAHRNKIISGNIFKSPRKR